MTLRFGLAGAGNIARTYVEILRDLVDVDVVAIADVDAAAAASLAAASVRTFGSAVEMFDAAALDAVVVCTPPVSHPEISLAALGRGVAVLCEKPLAIGVRSAQTMIAAARAHGVHLTMATKFRFVADVIRAKELVGAGELGELIRLENRFASRVDMRHRWNSDRAVSGGGVLIDNGTHSVDIARYFLGPIREVLVVEGPRVAGLGVEDSVQVVLRAASGATATIELSWSYDHATDTYLEVSGSAGLLRVGWHASEFRRNDAAAWTRFGDGYDKRACMRAQVENFCQALSGVEATAITDADAVASVQVIDAAYRSLALGDWTLVEPVQPVDRADVVA